MFQFYKPRYCFKFQKIPGGRNKKGSGLGKSTIVFQFLGETFIITLISLLSAIILVRALLAGFNSMFNYDIHLRLLDFKMIAFFIAIALFTGLISGLLPALYLASSNPISVLKGKIITEPQLQCLQTKSYRISICHSNCSNNLYDDYQDPGQLYAQFRCRCG